MRWGVAWLCRVEGAEAPVDEVEGAGELWSAVRSLLSSDELGPVLAYRRWVDRWRAAISRLMVRLLVEGVTGRRVRRGGASEGEGEDAGHAGGGGGGCGCALSIRRDAYGKPRVALEGEVGEEERRWSETAFSVSHHGQWLLLVAQWPHSQRDRQEQQQQMQMQLHMPIPPDPSQPHRPHSSALSSDSSPPPPSPPPSPSLPPPVLLGCDVTCVELPLRVAVAYEVAFPVVRGLPLPSLSSALSSASTSPYRPCAALLSDYLDAFHSVFTPAEWRSIVQQRIPTPAEVRERGKTAVDAGAGDAQSERHRAPPRHCLSAFSVLWSVKEAVVKAVGQGLSMDLTAFQATQTQRAQAQQGEEREVDEDAPLSADLYAPFTLQWLPSPSAPPHRTVGQAGPHTPCPVCRSSTSFTCHCPCPCTACCAALRWEVEVTSIDERHSAAVVTASTAAGAAPHLTRPPQPPHPLAALGQPASSTGLKSHALRVLTIQQLLQAITALPV